MSRILQVMVIATCLLFQLGCGSEEKSEASAESAEAPSESAEAPSESAEAPSVKSSKPFAMEQQLIKDAGEVQGILDKNAEAKKKAIKDSN